VNKYRANTLRSVEPTTLQALEIYQKIPIRFKEVSLSETLKIVVEHRIYAMNVYPYTEARQNLAS